MVRGGRCRGTRQPKIHGWRRLARALRYLPRLEFVGKRTALLFYTPLCGGSVEIRTKSRAGTPICTTPSASHGSEPSPQFRSGRFSAFRRDLKPVHRMHQKIRQQTTERQTHSGTMDGWVKALPLSSIGKGCLGFAGSAATTGVAGARMISGRIAGAGLGSAEQNSADSAGVRVNNR